MNKPKLRTTKWKSISQESEQTHFNAHEYEESVGSKMSRQTEIEALNKSIEMMNQLKMTLEKF